MNSIAALKFFEENPRATAKEAGLTTSEANALVGQGKLMQAGKRQTGKKGRPPIEYVVVGYDLTEDPQAQEAVKAAQNRVRAHRLYERQSSAIVRAADEHGHGSDAHTEAIAMRRETFSVLPPLPSSNDYALAGVIVDSAPLIDTEDDFEVEVAA